jgi:uncharacterized protein DUF5679
LHTVRRRRFPFARFEALRPRAGKEIAMERIEGYCVTCRGKRELTETRNVQRSGVPTIAGKCCACGSTVFVLGASAPVPADETSEG